jgi:acyl-coenzyme A synthetase/AMP-(fatty) acid ligase
VYRDDEGYYYHMDRLVDSVELGDGKRLYTAMTEERILAACPEILDCTVVAVHDGRRVVTDILLQLRAGADRDRDYAKDVGAAIDEHVFATLRDVVVVDEDSIPLGPTGKVRKFVLRQRHLEERGAR